MGTDKESANCGTRARVMTMMRRNEVEPPEDPAALPSRSLGKDEGGEGKGAGEKKGWCILGNRLSSQMVTSKSLK